MWDKLEKCGGTKLGLLAEVNPGLLISPWLLLKILTPLVWLIVRGPLTLSVWIYYFLHFGEHY